MFKSLLQSISFTCEKEFGNLFEAPLDMITHTLALHIEDGRSLELAVGPKGGQYLS